MLIFEKFQNCVKQCCNNFFGNTEAGNAKAREMMFSVNNGNTRIMREICYKLTSQTLEDCQ